MEVLPQWVQLRIPRRRRRRRMTSGSRGRLAEGKRKGTGVSPYTDCHNFEHSLNCNYWQTKLKTTKKRDTLLLLLSENNIFFNQPDMNEDSLHHLLTLMAGKSDMVVDDMLKAHRQGHVAKPMPVDSIFKNKAALIAYALPYVFEALCPEHLWKPMKLLNWQPSASSVQ